MGAHNRITRQKYQQIKAELAAPKDDKRVMRKYGISQSTARSIRNSDNYDYYRKWVAGDIHKQSVNPPQIIITKLPKTEPDLAEKADRRALLATTAFMLFFLVATIAIITILIKVSDK